MQTIHNIQLHNHLKYILQPIHITDIALVAYNITERTSSED